MKMLPNLCFSIMLNTEKHLLMDGYDKEVHEHYDYYVIAEGAVQHCRPNQSWKQLPPDVHNNGKSKDRTLEILQDLSSTHDNIDFVTPPDGEMWYSKDEMVNAAVDKIRERYPDGGVLWQRDADEKFSKRDIWDTVRHLSSLDPDSWQSAKFDQWMHWGNHHVQVGPLMCANKRCWNWRGERHLSHVPNLIEGEDPTGSKTIKVNGPRYHHYNYVFEEDVLLRDRWYPGHEGLHRAWKEITGNNLYRDQIIVIDKLFYRTYENPDYRNLLIPNQFIIGP